MNTENNKLIAEFMDWEVVNNQSQLWVDCNPSKEQKPLLLLNYIFDDWNWLMEVVDKIINLKSVYAQERQKVFNSISPNMEATYNACVEFIKWYNEQKNIRP